MPEEISAGCTCNCRDPTNIITILPVCIQYDESMIQYTCSTMHMHMVVWKSTYINCYLQNHDIVLIVQSLHAEFTWELLIFASQSLATIWVKASSTFVPSFALTSKSGILWSSANFYAYIYMYGTRTYRNGIKCHIVYIYICYWHACTLVYHVYKMIPLL